MTIKVNIGGPSTGENSKEDDGVDCKCTKDTWPIVLLCTGFGVAFLVVLVNVLSLLNFEGVPQVVLSVYMIIMAFIGLEAEFRRFKFLRSLIYTFVIKYFYFLTNYYVRGAYYIFLGSILLGDKPLNIIAGGVCMALGVLLIGVHFWVGLPNYTDWQEVQAEAEARIKHEADAVAAKTAAFRSGSTPGAHDHAQTAQQPAPPSANPAYQPAAAPPPQQHDASRNPYVQSANTSPGGAEREPEVPSARRMQHDDDLARQYYAQQQQPYSPRDTSGSGNVFEDNNRPQQSPQQPQVYGSNPNSRRNMAADNPFDAADEYQPPRF